MRLLLQLVSVLLLFALVGMPYQAVNQDDRIHDEVIRKLAADRDVKGNTFEVEVKDGVVTVAGEVVKEQHREKAERIIKKVKGVKSVVNKLAIKQY